MIPKNIVQEITIAAKAMNDPKRSSFYFGDNVQDSQYYYDNISIGQARIRSISRPSPALMKLQRALLSAGLRDIPIHYSATAYRRGGSIASNARRHVASPYLFKTDLIDFFPSIRVHSILDLLVNSLPGMPEEMKDDLGTVLSKGGRLAAGAPTSPHLSNVFMRTFDHRVTSFARSRDISYSRYSDDIALSGTSMPAIKEVSDFLIKEACELGQRINEPKTRLFGPGCRKIVTGLDVTTHSIRPTRRFRRKTAALVRILSKYGKEGLVKPVHGRLSFWNGVAPLDPELATLRNQYHEGIKAWKLSL